jgi:hypothetical protein
MIMEVKHSKSLVTNPESIRARYHEDRSRTAAGAALGWKPLDLANCVYPRQRCRAFLNEGIELV